MIFAFSHHWPLVLGVTVVGALLGAAFVAISCLVPLIRLRLAVNDPAKQACVLRREIAHLRRLGDAAAVAEEHGLPGAGELRAEAELRALLLWLALRRAWAVAQRR